MLSKNNLDTVRWYLVFLSNSFKPIYLPHRWYFSYVPPSVTVSHGPFLGGSGPICARRLQKSLRLCQHSPKEGYLWCQAINLTHPKRVKALEDNSLRLDDAGQGAPRPTATATRTHPTRSVFTQTRLNSVWNGWANICPVEGILIDTTTPNQKRRMSYGNKKDIPHTWNLHRYVPLDGLHAFKTGPLDNPLELM